MKLNSKLTGGLAWAGLIVILAVPSADMLTAPKGESAAHITSDMDAIRTASVEVQPDAPVPATRPSADPVDSYLSSGKKLPSYISDAPTEAAETKPATTIRLVVPTGSGNGGGGEDPAATEVATTASEPKLVAPVPYPASMRPEPPVTTAAVESPAADEAPLIVDEQLVARREAAVSRVLDDSDFYDDSPRIISGDELEEWDSGSLADYLERRDLMSEDEETWRAEASGESEYDEDGFFLDEGPNSDRRLIRRVRPRDFFFF